MFAVRIKYKIQRIHTVPAHTLAHSVVLTRKHSMYEPIHRARIHCAVSEPKSWFVSRRLAVGAVRVQFVQCIYSNAELLFKFLVDRFPWYA